MGAGNDFAFLKSKTEQFVYRRATSLSKCWRRPYRDTWSRATRRLSHASFGRLGSQDPLLHWFLTCWDWRVARWGISKFALRDFKSGTEH